MLFDICLERRNGTIITVGAEKNPPQASEAVSKTSSKEATKSTSAPLSSSESEARSKEATKGTSAESAKHPPPLSSSESEARSKEATKGTTSQDLPAPPSAEREAAKLPQQMESHPLHF
jgi:hypothetical protein